MHIAVDATAHAKYALSAVRHAEGVAAICVAQSRMHVGVSRMHPGAPTSRAQKGVQGSAMGAASVTEGASIEASDGAAVSVGVASVTTGVSVGVTAPSAGTGVEDSPPHAASETQSESARADRCSAMRAW